jgi:hypothetical protein
VPSLFLHAFRRSPPQHRAARPRDPPASHDGGRGSHGREWAREAPTQSSGLEAKDGGRRSCAAIDVPTEPRRPCRVWSRRRRARSSTAPGHRHMRSPCAPRRRARLPAAPGHRRMRPPEHGDGCSYITLVLDGREEEDDVGSWQGTGSREPVRMLWNIK